jgi:putative transcriptional regulator
VIRLLRFMQQIIKHKVTNKVQLFREEKNLSKSGLADLLDVSRQTIIAIEKGNYIPSVLLAMRIARFFEVPLEEIFDYEEI